MTRTYIEVRVTMSDRSHTLGFKKQIAAAHDSGIKSCRGLDALDHQTGLWPLCSLRKFAQNVV